MSPIQARCYLPCLQKMWEEATVNVLATPSFCLALFLFCLSYTLLFGYRGSLVDETALGCVIQACVSPGGVVNIKCLESVLESFALATM